MNGYCYFSPEEHADRLRRVRETMSGSGLDACLITSPENIFYLTGLDHQGYFGPHVLVLPVQGEPVLLARAHEAPTVERQVGNARFQGYRDTEEPGEIVTGVLGELDLPGSTIGIQRNSLGFPPSIYESILSRTPGVIWGDAEGIVETCRRVLSAAEIEYVRHAAAITDKIQSVAFEAAAEGVGENEIAASVHKAMFDEGGDPVGFGPFIRAGERLPYEHEVWSERKLGRGDQLILEMSACYRRYHAPCGRLVYVGSAPDGTEAVAEICIEAQQNVLEAMRPGAVGADVYHAWQSVIDKAGMAHYRRHHCGYSIGIGFPPTWTGGIGVVSMHSESNLVLEPGMVFHQLSWLLGCGRGDYFVSDTVLVTVNGGERLTSTPRELTIV